MSALDVAGVAGTWAAAGLAIITLVGIIGPILAFRAARDVRHKALISVGRNNNGFISPGIPVLPGARFRFFQIVRAPKLRKPRDIELGEWTSFNLSCLRRLPHSPATWVQLAACLQAYGVAFEQGDHLDLDGTTTALPVHASYLKLFGILGRYSDTKPKKRIITKPKKSRWRLNEDTLHTELDDELSPVRRPRLSTTTATELHGITGTLVFNGTRRSTTQVTFHSDLEELLQSPVKEQLELKDLILLVDGFLPTPQGGHVNLNNARIVADDAIDEEELQLRREESVTTHHLPQPPKTLAQSQCIELIPTSIENELVDLLRTPSTAVNKAANMPYQILTYVKIDILERSHFATLAASTFVPAEEPWIRLPADYSLSDSYGHLHRKTSTSARFLRRKDAQLMAYSLLRMPWHPSGYLIYGLNQRSYAMDLLLSRSEMAMRFLFRLKEGVQFLRLSDEAHQRFFPAAAAVLHDLPSHENLCVLDDALSFLLEHRQQASSTPRMSWMVGVLVLTNEEFAGLVYQSLRYLDAAAKSQVEFDLITGTVKVPSAFGVVQTFIVDVTEVFGSLPPVTGAGGNGTGTGTGLTSTGGSSIVTMNHAMILVAALWAYMRSLMLFNCVDSEPLIWQLSKHKEKVFSVR